MVMCETFADRGKTASLGVENIQALGRPIHGCLDSIFEVSLNIFVPGRA